MRTEISISGILVRTQPLPPLQLIESLGTRGDPKIWLVSIIMDSACELLYLFDFWEADKIVPFHWI